MPEAKFAFEALGTAWEISTDTPLELIEKDEIGALIETFDYTYSRFRADSLVTQMAENTGIYTFPEHARELFTFYETLYEMTNGQVTPLVGNALEALGYDAAYSFLQKAQPQKALEYKKVIKRKGIEVTVTRPVMLDFGAAGKGHLVDLVARLLESHGRNVYTIDASGDVFHKGDEPEEIGLEHPFDADKIIGVVPLRNRALCGSAVTRRAWGKGLHHIIDPKTGEPTEGIIATWVVADTALMADGLATALFFTDPKVLLKKYNYEYVRVHSDKTVEYSPYFKEFLY